MPRIGDLKSKKFISENTVLKHKKQRFHFSSKEKKIQMMNIKLFIKKYKYLVKTNGSKLHQ